MTAAETMLVLAERCEREQPSWELSVDIELAVTPGATRFVGKGPFAVEKDHRRYNPPAYTTGIDAALMLVPEDWCVSVSSTCQGHWRASLYHCGAHNGPRTVEALQDKHEPHIKSGPLALCAAALRARAQEAEVAGEEQVSA